MAASSPTQTPASSASAAAKSRRPSRTRRPSIQASTPCPGALHSIVHRGLHPPGRWRAGIEERPGNRMLAALLHRRGNRQAGVRFEAAGSFGQYHREAPLGQRAGLVEHDVGDACEGFDGVERVSSTPRRDSAAPAAASAAGMASDSAQGQLTTSTATVTNNARDGSIQPAQTMPVTAAIASSAPTKPACDAVGQHRQPWLFREGTIQHRHDLGQPRIGADAPDAHLERAGRVETPGEYGIADTPPLPAVPRRSASIRRVR